MKIVLILNAVLVALIAGLMFSYACSVTPGLRKLPDAEYLHAMQQINRAIVNPVFLTTFLTPVVLYILSGWLIYRQEGASTLFVLACISGIVYFVGVFLVTGMKNVPLNDALDKVVLSAGSAESLHRHRENFEYPWNRFHLVRTLAAVSSLVIMLLALIRVR